MKHLPIPATLSLPHVTARRQAMAVRTSTSTSLQRAAERPRNTAGSVIDWPALRRKLTRSSARKGCGPPPGRQDNQGAGP